jgi:hypothetical protein
MMDQGHARRDVGDHRGALDQFRGADAIMHVPTTGIEVAREQIALGLLVEASDTLSRVRRTSPTAPESELFRAARKNAEAMDDELQARIPALRIAVIGATNKEDLLVTVDDVHVPPEALVSPFKVNPGHHVVKAATPASTASQEADVAEGQTIPVTVTIPAPAASAQEDRPTAPATVDAPEAAPRSRGAAPWLRWGGFGLAIVGVGVGSVTGIMSISKTASVSKGCVNDQCSPSAKGDIDSARTTATIADVSFAAAGVGLVLGVTSLFLSRTPDAAAAPARTSFQVAPAIGLASAGITGKF